MPSRRISDQYTHHNKVSVVRGGADYFKGIEEIADGAQYSLHLQTYIFDGDETGIKVADALMRAAARGVLVYLLLDGYASQHLPKELIAKMKEAGVHFDFFSPFFKSNSYYIGRRLHHKVIVADARVGMVAGINISNRYNDIGDTKAWLDWAVRAEGEVAQQLNDICVHIWNRAPKRERCKAAKNPPSTLSTTDCQVRVRRNDWAFSRIQITRSYREMFSEAQTEVTMMTSYFWPPQKLLKRMAAATKRGVRIRVILTAKADVPLSKNVERYLYSWLFRNKIEVYEYQANVLHGKLAVRDGKWLTAGSYNVNNISAYASVELNLDINDTAIAKDVTTQLQKIITNDCVQVTEQDFSIKNGWLHKLRYYLSYRLIHLVFYLFTFYFIQKREQN